MPQLPEPERQWEPLLVFAAVVHFVNVPLNIYGRGWRDASWTAYLLLGTSFLLIAPLPQEVRRSYRRTLTDWRGITAMAFILTSMLLWVVRMAARHDLSR